jgi:hypothetical protein
MTTDKRETLIRLKLHHLQVTVFPVGKLPAQAAGAALGNQASACVPKMDLKGKENKK